MDWRNYYPETNLPGPTFDDWVETLNIKRGGHLFFVEIGAMDGVKHDALHKHIIKNPGWSGLLAEPLPDMFKKLQQTYRGRNNLAFENVAITEKSGRALISRIPLDKIETETPAWADGISTLKPANHIISQYTELKPHIVKESIKTMTFSALATKHGIETIDLLQIDAEGYDKEIFDQIWAAGYRPALIKLEINYMTYKTIKDLRWLLNEQGYTCFYEGDDLIAVKS